METSVVGITDLRSKHETTSRKSSNLCPFVIVLVAENVCPFTVADVILAVASGSVAIDTANAENSLRILAHDVGSLQIAL